MVGPFLRFAKVEAAGGIVLAVSTIIALAWANSRWEGLYHHLLETPIAITLGRFTLSESVHAWINDGLMTLFFFLVGLEIKRELLDGELSTLRRATFPFLAALGGMVGPAALYLWMAHGSPAQRGWAIPMSTDIAFTLGVLTFLGKRVPVALKVFVTALAIVDDIFAVIVIALFYTTGINYIALGVGVAGLLLSLLANVLGVRKPAVYAMIGITVWIGMLHSGVHATLAGILLAFTIPTRTYLDESTFVMRSRALLAERSGNTEQEIVDGLQQHLAYLGSPLHRIEHNLQPWISFVVMPLFALANAGLSFSSGLSGAAHQPVTWGIVLGLFFGKPFGIFLFAWLAVVTKAGLRPEGTSWGQIFGAAWLCGIGFTMSLFIATLAFDDPHILEMSKLAILSASFAAALCGSLVMDWNKPKALRRNP